jgi:hypothetical protein
MVSLHNHHRVAGGTAHVGTGSPISCASTNVTDNARISGSLTNILMISNVLVSDAGSYQVVVTNAYGSTNSAVTTLTVILPPQVQAITQTGTALSFAWNAGTGRTYQVQYKNALTDGAWLPLGSPITAAGGTATASDAITNSQRYYGVELLP